MAKKPGAIKTAATPTVDYIDLNDPKWGGPGTTDDPPPAPVSTEPDESHDLAVQAALYSRAVGLNGLPPDTAACRAWLQSRRPEKWGEKPAQQLRVVIDRMGDGRERIAVGLGQTVAVIDQ